MGTTSQGIVYPDASDPIANLQPQLQGLAESVDLAIAPLEETAASLGVTVSAGWAVSAFSATRIGIVRAIQARLSYSGATITAGASGNIADQTLITGLPEDWRPPIATVFAYGCSGVSDGVGVVNPTGTITLQSLSPTASIAAGDIITLNAFFLVAP